MENNKPFTYCSEPIAWHRKALKEAEHAHESGQADFVEWDAAKQYLRDNKNDPF